MINREITLTYLNIRQSISILLAKLFFIDFIAAILVIFSYYSIVKGGEISNYRPEYTTIFIAVFTVLGFLKIVFDFYVVLRWLFEYYEITPDYINHKSGVIFRKEEKYRLDNVRAMEVYDSFVGEILNFGTITLYDIRLHKYLDMYLIHNPSRYAKILTLLKPHIEIKKEETFPFVRSGEWKFGKI